MGEEILMHYGVGWNHNPPGIGSGRFPHGSGDNPNQHINTKSLAEQKAYWESKGLSGLEVAERLGYSSTTELRNEISRQKDERMYAQSKKIWELYSKGITSPTEIERLTGINESQVRSIIKKQGQSRLEESNRVKNELRELVKQDKYIDVGRGAEIALGISDTKKDRLLRELKEEGYELHNLHFEQMGTNYKTTIQVLCPPGTDGKQLQKDLYKNPEIIKSVDRFMENPDGERSVLGLPPVNSVDLDRVYIRYPEDGGAKKDGVIELRRGPEDISLGNAIYAQVRIGVDGKYYLKGMAVYGNDKDFPEGKDIIFNTSKDSDLPLNKVLKEMKTLKGTDIVDQDNPFGASIKRQEELRLAQRTYIDPKTGEEKVSAINVVNEEGDWEKWSKNLSSQFLSKQPLPLINQQLNLAYLKKVDELEDIKSITNSSVKRALLQDYADKCDSAAVDLKAAKLPRQQTHVILPLTSIKDDQIYAPNYEHGEEVILVRYPHAGTFEIPKLTVNNHNKEGIQLLGKHPIDAVGISAKAASQLSGADYDGDTVLVIPTKGNKIQVDKAQKDLRDFDQRHEYAAYDGMIEVKKDPAWNKQTQMGMVSNLITDMTLQGAPLKDTVKAVRHSMVIIDAEKHNLDWRRSEKDHEIDRLKRLYQRKPNAKGAPEDLKKSEYGGAGTLISKASSQYDIEQQSFRFHIDKDTGVKTILPTGATKMGRRKTGEVDEKGRPIYENTGKYEKIKQKSTKMRETDDAYTLLSGYDPSKDDLSTKEGRKIVEMKSYTKEVPYAIYANRMKALGNEARKIYMSLDTAKKDPSAEKIYEKEAKSLKDKAYRIKENAPKERQAQLRAGNQFYKKKNELDDLDKDDIKKLKSQCLAEARAHFGAKGVKVEITPKEWEAIENRAVSGTTVEKLIKKADNASIMKYALPKGDNTLSKAKQNRIKAMSNGGASTAEIAEELGISPSTVQKYLS